MIREDEDLVVRAELPGAKPEDVDHGPQRGPDHLRSRKRGKRNVADTWSGNAVLGHSAEAYSCPMTWTKIRSKPTSRTASWRSRSRKRRRPGTQASRSVEAIARTKAARAASRRLRGWKGGGAPFGPDYFPDRRSLVPPPEGAPIREDGYILQRTNAARRKILMATENVRRLRHQAGSRHSEAGCSRRRSEGRAPLRDPRCWAEAGRSSFGGRSPLGGAKPLRRLLRPVLRRRAQRTLRRERARMASPDRQSR